VAISIEQTPNPNALKFSVGQPVGGPITLVPGGSAEHPLADPLLAIPGVGSVFMTADFVTVSKTPEGDWATIAPTAEAILEEHYG